MTLPRPSPYAIQRKRRWKDFKKSVKEHAIGLYDVHFSETPAEDGHVDAFIKRNLISTSSSLPKSSTASAFTQLIYKTETTLAKQHHDLVTKIIKKKIPLYTLWYVSFHEITNNIPLFLDALVEEHFLLPNPTLAIKKPSRKSTDSDPKKIKSEEAELYNNVKKALRSYLAEVTAWHYLDECTVTEKSDLIQNFTLFEKSRCIEDLDEVVKSALVLCPILKFAYPGERHHLRRALISYLEFKKSHPNKSFTSFYVSPCTYYSDVINTHLSTHTFDVPVARNDADSKASPSRSHDNSPAKQRYSPPQQQATHEEKKVETPKAKLQIPTLQLPKKEEHDVSSSPRSLSRPNTPSSRRSSQDATTKATIDQLPDVPSFWRAVTVDPFYWLHTLVELPIEMALVFLDKCDDYIPGLKIVMGGILMGIDLVSYVITHGLSFLLQEIGAFVVNLPTICGKNEVTQITPRDEIGSDIRSARSSQRRNSTLPTLPSAPPQPASAVPGVVILPATSETESKTPQADDTRHRFNSPRDTHHARGATMFGSSKAKIKLTEGDGEVTLVWQPPGVGERRESDSRYKVS